MGRVCCHLFVQPLPGCKVKAGIKNDKNTRIGFVARAFSLLGYGDLFCFQLPEDYAAQQFQRYFQSIHEAATWDTD